MSLSVYPVESSRWRHVGEASPFALAAAAAIAHWPRSEEAAQRQSGRKDRLLLLEGAARRLRQRHLLALEAMLRCTALRHAPGRLTLPQMMQHVSAGMEGNGVNRPGCLLQTRA